VPLGNLSPEQFRGLAAVMRRFAGGNARTQQNQNLVLRWVHEASLPALHSALKELGLGDPDAELLADTVACPGTDSCKMGITSSQGVGAAISAAAKEWNIDDPLVQKISVKSSGCPNGCGQHHVAGLGFQGSVRKVGGKALPQYFVMLGGGVEKDGAHFGRIAAKIPARRIPEAVERLIALYGKERRAGEAAAAFFRRVDAEQVSRTLGDLEKITAEDAVAEDFVDLAEEHEFVVETMGGECSA
jgi:sulfite reductase beta subunit-like hemoprotein